MKNIIVFGASGGTGLEVVEQALEAGHHVTAILRHPDKFTIRHEQLRIIQGDVLQKGDQVRHDSELLMRLVLENYNEHVKQTKE